MGETNVLNVSEVTDYVRVDQDVHIKLFYKSSSLLLPQWFRHGRLSSYEKKYDDKLPKLYQIRERTDVQYFGRAQRA